MRAKKEMLTSNTRPAVYQIDKWQNKLIFIPHKHCWDFSTNMYQGLITRALVRSWIQSDTHTNDLRVVVIPFKSNEASPIRWTTFILVFMFSIRRKHERFPCEVHPWHESAWTATNDYSSQGTVDHLSNISLIDFNIVQLTCHIFNCLEILEL